MYSIKFLKWIQDTFGPSQAGDYFDLTEKISQIKPQGSSASIITEMRITFQKKIYDPDLLKNESLMKFREELDVLSEYSIADLQFMETAVTNFPNEKEVQQKRIDRSAAQGGKAFLMKLEIIHRRRIKNG